MELLHVGREASSLSAQFFPSPGSDWLGTPPTFLVVLLGAFRWPEP